MTNMKNDGEISTSKTNSWSGDIQRTIVLILLPRDPNVDFVVDKHVYLQQQPSVLSAMYDLGSSYTLCNSKIYFKLAF